MEADSRTKICTKCNVEKPLEAYYKQAHCKYGVASVCKSCISLLNKSRINYSDNLPPDYLKKCFVCGIEKSIEHFYKSGSNLDGLDGRCKHCRSFLYNSRKRRSPCISSEYIKECVVCKKKKVAEHFYKNLNNLDGLYSTCKSCVSVINKSKNNIADPTNRDKLKLCVKCRIEKPQYDFHKHRRTPDGLRTWCKECTTNTTLKYVKENPAKDAARAASRRAQKLKSTPRWADKSTIDALYTEADELTKSTNVRHSVDHIVPLNSPIVCGLHCEHNLRIITLSENCSKRNRYWPDMP